MRPLPPPPQPVRDPNTGKWPCPGCGTPWSSELAAVECCDPAWEPDR